MRLVYGAYQLALEVTDDGCGIEDAVLRAGRREGHWGLVGMRERAARIAGQLQIDSSASHGTKVGLLVPLPRGNASGVPQA